MSFEIVTLPCLADNYAFLLHENDTGTTALFDAPEEAPILRALAERGWSLDQVFLTHHHYDHVDGLAGILAEHSAEVIGNAQDADRLPPLHRKVTEGDMVPIGSGAARVMDVSGHTFGHLAFHVEAANAVFTADSLMALGCGRLFEGPADQMWASLQKLMALPPETLVCSGHEYTLANGRFAMTIEPGNPDLVARIDSVKAARAKGEPTVPSTLGQELATNPFLRGHVEEVQKSVGMTGQDAGAVFAKVRQAKDNF
ncbi:MAG: hydroxyacylglutathione hydrolase [Paracoccaceae bacterium]|jgi:hydroxyacylglutathione hydrolase|nr:hydroxyacylglutathione hydrolase [Paracoccaceae bacterium]MDP7185376.1 hydroxyacylglutathione hydrolase [Paracoccaceae bacterium]